MRHNFTRNCELRKSKLLKVFNRNKKKVDNINHWLVTSMKPGKENEDDAL